MAEYLDIYDIYRRPTGRTVERYHRRFVEGDYYLTVHLILFDERGRMLIQRRVEDKKSFPGMWDIAVSGLAQAGDTSQTAIEREAREELGLSISLEGKAPHLSFLDGHSFNDFWIAQIDSQTPLILQPEEVAEVRWVTREEWNTLIASGYAEPYCFHRFVFDWYKQYGKCRFFPFGDPERIEGVVFDMDGLLLDTERVAKAMWRKAASQMGLEHQIEIAIPNVLGMNENGTRRYFAETFGDSVPFEEFLQRSRRLTHEVTDVKVPVKDGAIVLLERLRSKGIPCAVASSTRRVTVIDQLGRSGLLPYFEEVITGDMVTHGKPHPEIFLKACESLGLPPRHCLAYEDSTNGIRSAYRASMYPVHIPDLSPSNGETRTLAWKTFPSLEESMVLFC